MTRRDIPDILSEEFAAGGETTDRAIAAVFANPLARPEQLAAVRADRTLIGRALAETLRHSPPVHMIMRQSLPLVFTPVKGVRGAG